MTDYDEIAKYLRRCMYTDPGSGNCDGCPVYGGDLYCKERLKGNAADAIENLQKRLKIAEAERDDMARVH